MSVSKLRCILFYRLLKQCVTADAFAIRAVTMKLPVPEVTEVLSVFLNGIALVLSDPLPIVYKAEYNGDI